MASEASAHDELRLPDSGDSGSTGGARRRRGWIAGAFVLFVLAALYAAAALYVGDKVPAQTRIGGVAVGGMSADEARSTLERELTDEAAREITVTREGAAEGQKGASLDPKAAGLSYDYDASVDGLTGFSLSPVALYHHVSGGVDRPIEVSVDEDALADAVDKAAASMEAKPVEGSVKLVGSEVEVTPSKPGRSVDRDAVTTAISEDWPSSVRYSAPTAEIAPTLTQAEIERFVTEDLEPLVSGPVTIKTTDPTKDGAALSYSVPAELIASTVSVKSSDGTLSAQIDDTALAAAVTKTGADQGVLTAPKDAGVEVRGPRDFVVTPSSTGVGLADKSVVKPVREAMTKEGAARVAEVTSVLRKPETSTAEAKKTLPTEQISTFSTTLPDNPKRTENIAIAARALDGTYVAPGETFSLNAVLGERTAAKGYNKAGVILGGRLREDYGGGISQLSTTLFNAIFFSGAKIEEFHPHSFYISRYPEGREATISWPDLDNRFTNDTGAGIVISAKVSGDQVTVSFYGRTTYEIEARKGPRTNITQPRRITDSEAGCVAQSPAPGFSVQITRIFKKDGAEVNRSTFTTTYDPQDGITCTG